MNRSEYIGVGTYSSNRFLFLVILFIIRIILMIIRPNLHSISLGGDGLGMVSYCLVIYYRNNSLKINLSDIITCLTNRIGDIGLLIYICWLISYDSWHFIFYVNLNKILGLRAKNYYRTIFLYHSYFYWSTSIPFLLNCYIKKCNSFGISWKGKLWGIVRVSGFANQHYLKLLFVWRTIDYEFVCDVFMYQD